MAEILEIGMLLSFGFSWPLNLIKNIKSKSTKGVSLAFYICIFFGYICGIASKLFNESFMNNFNQKGYVLVFYVLNLIFVGANIIVYFKNKREEKKSK